MPAIQFAIELPPDLSEEDLVLFIAYFEKVRQNVEKILGKDPFTDQQITAGMSFYGLNLGRKLVRHMHNKDVVGGSKEILTIELEIAFIENLYHYALDRHKVDLKDFRNGPAILANINEWHEEMRIIAMGGSYEDGYQATMRFVKEYWINQPAQGKA